MGASDDTAALVRMYRTQPRAFRAERVTLRLWQHGGGPGPGLFNEAIELELRPDGGVTGVFNRTSFDQSYEPPFLHERFTGAVSKERAESLLTQLLGGPLFVAEHPAERDPKIGGVMKEEWDLERGSAHAHKLFYNEPFPAEYDAPRKAAEALKADLVQHGARQLLSKKRDAR